jgi:hypothetical protein
VGRNIAGTIGLQRKSNGSGVLKDKLPSRIAVFKPCASNVMVLLIDDMLYVLGILLDLVGHQDAG